MGAPPTIEFASLGMADSLILMVLALVVFGPRRLPQIGRQLGKLMYEFRKASNDFKYQMEEELRAAEEADRRKKEGAQHTLTATAGSAAVAADPPVAVNAVESPYPGEGHYPPATAPEPSPAEETALRIQPPATGEPVPATRPSRMAGLDEPAAEVAAESAAPAEGSAAPATTEPTSTATEAVSHNG